MSPSRPPRRHRLAKLGKADVKCLLAERRHGPRRIIQVLNQRCCLHFCGRLPRRAPAGLETAPAPPPFRGLLVVFFLVKGVGNTSFERQGSGFSSRLTDAAHVGGSGVLPPVAACFRGRAPCQGREISGGVPVRAPTARCAHATAFAGHTPLRERPDILVARAPLSRIPLRAVHFALLIPSLLHANSRRG